MKKTTTLFIAFLFFISLVYAQNLPPAHGFLGTAPGSQVSAQINSEEVGSSPVTSGRYVLVIEDGDGSYVGQTIYFFVDGVQANENAVFENGGHTNLDLTLNNPGGRPSGGEGGSNTNKNLNSQNTQSSNSNNIENLEFESQDNNDEISDLNQNENQNIKSSGITGAVIGFAKSGIGIGLLFAILIIIVVIAIVGFRKRNKI